jgi:hypothetical protein
MMVKPVTVSVEFEHMENSGHSVRIAEVMYPIGHGDAHHHLVEVEIERVDDGSTIVGRITWEAWMRGLRKMCDTEILPLVDLLASLASTSEGTVERDELGEAAVDFGAGAGMLARARGLTDAGADQVAHFSAAGYYVGHMRAVRGKR